MVDSVGEGNDISVPYTLRQPIRIAVPGAASAARTGSLKNCPNFFA
jgi:hypothetical protein